MEAQAQRKKVLARSSHRKSRQGCLECKRRRVKCDESKPACDNCTRRSLTCHYTTTRNRATSFSPPHTEGSIPSLEGPDLGDLQLWHHWLTVVCYTFSDDANSLIMWQENIPKIALQNRFVAQLLLALSALHLARTDEPGRSSHLAKSTVLQTNAMSGMMSALTDEPSSSRSSALYVAAMLLCFCSLGNRPSPGQYLLYSDEGVPPWMDLLQGVKSILTQHRHIITGIGVEEAESEPRQPIVPDEVFPGYSKAMDELTQHISILRAEDESFDKYTHALEMLQSSFETAFELHDGQTKMRPHLVLAWMYRISEDFQASLHERRPMALVIMAHYMTIFARQEKTWYVEGWTRHIMKAIEKDLHPAYQRWLEWPASQLEGAA